MKRTTVVRASAITPLAFQIPLFMVVEELETVATTTTLEMDTDNRMRQAVGGWEDWMGKTVEEAINHWYTLYEDFVQAFDIKIAQSRERQREAIDRSQKEFYKNLATQQQQQREVVYCPLSNWFRDEMTKIVEYAQACLLQNGIPDQEMDCLDEAISQIPRPKGAGLVPETEVPRP